MTNEEFSSLYKQLYVVCLDYFLKRNLEISKIKLKIKMKEEGRDAVLEDLECADLFEPQHCFYFDEEEIHRHSFIIAESFFTKISNHFLTEEFEEYQHYSTNPEILKLKKEGIQKQEKRND